MMLRRFEGPDGQRLLVELLESQTLVSGSGKLAAGLAETGKLVTVPAGATLIEQGAADNDVYFVIAGSFRIIVNGREVAARHAGTHVGEMAAIQPSQRRAASVVAAEDSVVLRLTESQFSALGNEYPEIWRRMAKEAARRLEQRNAYVTATHEKIRVFLMSSAESLDIARAIQTGLEHDPYAVTVWTDGVFRAGTYSLEALETAVEQSDFAIAIAHADDTTTVRGGTWPAPRDNVVFELGFFMGRLGRLRALLVEPRHDRLKLPSDLAGLTTLPYRWTGDRKELATAIAPVCNRLREIIEDIGPNN